MDLVKPGRFLLIAGEEDTEWTVAAEKVAADLSIPLDAVRVGHADGDYLDPRSTWAAHRGFGPRGAVLIRPDRFVAWRSIEGADDPVAEITAALDQIVGRSA